MFMVSPTRPRRPAGTSKALDASDRAVVLQRGTVTLAGSSASVRDQADELERAYL